MMYNPNTNKRQRLRLRAIANELSARYRYGFIEWEICGEDIEKKAPADKIVVYYPKGIRTYTLENGYALLKQNGSTLMRLSPEDFKLAGIQFPSK